MAEGAPAQGRLQPDDVLTSVDGTPVTDPVQLRTLIGDRAVGDTVRIGYRRGSTEATAELTTASSGETAAPAGHRRRDRRRVPVRRRRSRSRRSAARAPG